MEFNDLKVAVDKHFKSLQAHPLFIVDIDNDKLWETYLKSFPKGSDPMFKERTEHDCNCCKSFIRVLGKVVAIIDGKLVSIWDVNVGGHYQPVVDAMAKLVRSKSICGVFKHYEKNVGTDKNIQVLDNGKTITWKHFYCELPRDLRAKADIIGSLQANHLSNYQVLFRSLQELTLDSAEIVHDLIKQNSLYRGIEHLPTIELFIKLKKEFDKLSSKKKKEFFCWINALKLGNSSKIRSTVIGTLLTDISAGTSLDGAVKMFESKVAPANYKRPKALITKKMINSAQKKVEELGLLESLPRRYAVAEDLTINNVLFADRSVKPAMNVFDEMVSEVPISNKKFNKIEEVDINLFIKDILPKADKLEIFVDNKHVPNLMSLISPINKDSKHMFKWNNNFSWAYNGEVADSIKERVKKAGGNVSGVLRCSLSWYNYDDLDIHVIEPSGNKIYFRRTKNNYTSGQLDVDMNAGSRRSREAVENIVWTDKTKILEGKYKVLVNNYTLREAKDFGFEIEIEHDSQLHNFVYKKPVKSDETITVAEFDFSKSKGITFTKSIPSTQKSKEVWNINTNNFHKVTMMMNSPNYWDGERTGNKHWFFILDKCKNNDTARGFFNEFLNNELNEHRKVLETLGSKMRADKTNKQLSGLGFSSTQKNSVICKVTGTFNRTVKINF
jgi:hypothetical protein